ncbi:MAG: TonB-dependent receptor [Chthoniobacterales bacterium]|nr:TonB-dependent receptor [Chthoniobacterales bacterium]
MIRKVLYKLGSFRSALAVGVAVHFLIATSAFAQVGATQPTPASAPAATPAAGTGAGAVSDSAIADSTAGGTAGGAATAERVVVTGSYIPTAETESALPVTVYTATVLQKQGANTPAEGLRQLPSFLGNTATENDANGGDGSAFVNLRALGPGNTLTLINGRRAFSFADINAIPIGALSRSEVLKDGASAIYGSDAVAGVVNFILINGPGEAPYEGAEIDLLYGNTTDTDARVLQGYIRGGVATDKVSVAAAAEYYDREALFSRDRFIARTADVRSSSDGPSALDPFGPLGLGGFFPQSSLFPGSAQTTNPPEGESSLRILIDPTSVPTGPESYRANEGVLSNDRFNFNQFTSSIPAMEKYQTYVTGRYKIFGEGLQVYGDMLYSKRKQENRIAPSPFILFAGPPRAIGINSPLAGGIRSPFNPFGDDLSNVRYRTIRELGTRLSFFDYDYFRYTVGLNGNFTFTGNNFISYLGYDAGLVYDRGDFREVNENDAVTSLLVNEINAGNFNPFIGIQAPLAGLAPTFNRDGTPRLNADGTPRLRRYDNLAAAQRAEYLGISNDFSKNLLADVKVFGNLFPNLYQGGIGFNLGYEFRHNRFYTQPDPRQAANDVLGFNADAPRSFHQEVNSYFGELQIPLVISTMNIPFVRSLEAAVAYRYEKFDNKNQFGAGVVRGTDPKPTTSFNNNGDVRVSLRYQPVQDLTLRASFGESFLSPSPGQLFDPVEQNFPVLFDPVTNSAEQPTGGVFQGGNTALKPETTESYTAGLVITPRVLPGFTVTADFYQVYTKNLILNGSDFAQLALTQNGIFIKAGGNPASAPFADLITRENGPGGPMTGGVFSINSVTNNAGKRLVNGLDTTAAYQLPWTTFGTLTLSLGYNYFFTWKAEPVAGTGTHSFLGDFNSGTIPLAPGGIPYHKGFIRGEYEWKGLDFVATVNYISSYNDDSFNVFTVHGEEVVPTNDDPVDPQFNLYRRVSDYTTLDMQLSYEFVKPEAAPAAAADFSKDGKGGKNMVAPPVAGVEQGSFFQRMLWGTKLRVGVVNAFDRQPPTVLGAFNDNYDTSNYTIRNRYYYVGLNKKF